MQRDDFRCCDCADNESQLSVHHRYYVSNRMPWEYPNWCFKTLCLNCHSNRHIEHKDASNDQETFYHDVFEHMMDFLGAGDDFNESYIWDISTQIGIMRSDLGDNKVLRMILDTITDLRINQQQ